MTLVSKKFLRRARKSLSWVLPRFIAILIALGAVLAHSRLYVSDIGLALELAQTDLWFRIRGAIAPAPEVKIVAIDEPSYRELGFSHVKPLTRGAIADIVESLAKAGAQLVILDIFFLDEGDEPDLNRRLADALSSVPTFIGSFRGFLRDERTGAYTLTESTPRPLFASRAESVVLMEVLEDPKVRHFSLFRSDTGNSSLALTYARRPPAKQQPTSADLINYYGPPNTIPEISAYKVLRSSTAENAARFRGNIVLVGATVSASSAFSVKDSFFVPTSSASSSGVEIHATTISNLINQDWIRRFDPRTELAVLNAVLFVLTALLSRVSSLVGLLTIVAGATLWGVGAYASFLHHQLLPGISFFIILPAAFLLTTLSKLNFLARQYGHIEDMLGITSTDRKK